MYQQVGARGTRLVLIACCLAILAVGVNSTAIMAALPAMVSSLRMRPATVEWAVNAYLLASAMFIIMGGEAADRFGARLSSAVGCVLFALASLMIIVAPNGMLVVGARALQGLGAAFAVPGTLAAVTQAVTDAERAKSIGAWTGFLMLGFSIGPLVGGVVTHYAGWRVNFEITGLAIFSAGLVLWLYPGTNSRQTKRIDWLGLGLLAFFMVMLISGLHTLANIRSAPLTTIVPLVLAAIAFCAVIWAERGRPRPLLDLALFGNRDFALGCSLAFLLMFNIMALLLYYSLFAQSQDGLDMTAVAAGLSLAPLSVAMFVFARMTHRFAAVIGLRTMVVAGSLLLVAGCAITWISAADSQFAMLLFGLFVIGAGIAPPYASAPQIALRALPSTQAGKGSGTVNSCSFLGGTVGVTCGGIVFGAGGFSEVLVLVGLSAILSAGLSLRLRPA
jgi:DHA2 family multidrug resistance protein-like MFS transporter